MAKLDIKLTVYVQAEGANIGCESDDRRSPAERLGGTENG